MLILDIGAAFFCAVLAGMGVGSAGLFVMYLTLARGMSQLSAQGQNLIFFICASLFSFIVHIKQRDFKYRRLIILASGGLIGSVTGSLFAGEIPQAILRKIFGGLMILLGFAALLRDSRKRKEP